MRRARAGRIRRVSLVGAALVAATLVAACGPFRQSATAKQDTIVEAENHGFPDVVLYVVSSGDPWRVGLVPGNGTQSFTLHPAAFPGGTLQLMARPIAGRAFLLPAVSVMPGDKVSVILEFSAAQSQVMVTRP